MPQWTPYGYAIFWIVVGGIFLSALALVLHLVIARPIVRELQTLVRLLGG